MSARQLRRVVFARLRTATLRRRETQFLPDYRWFHAFRRGGAKEILDVLRDGPKIHPNPKCDTRVHETTLGIDPNCVYAYLGRTLETFGETALVLPINAIKGKVSPFDTGGLVNKINPVKALPDSDKRVFLNAFTWPISKIPSLLSEHPTKQTRRVQRYLAGVEPPDADGPSQLWPNSKATAAIWRSNNDWRAWTWEVRSPEQFDVSRLEEWTCSPALYAEILDHVDALAGAANWFEDVASRYVHGGVSNLVEQWKSRQAA
jgi:hypothetical protein